MQRADFAGLFKEMDGFPVVIRTLDPPLHEFLPKRENLMVDLARLPHADAKAKKEMSKNYRIPVSQLKKELPTLLARVEELHEFNPMLGHRGCRLGITYPEITEMQARAIFEAAVQVAKKGVKVIPEVMIPLIGSVQELENQKKIVVAVAEEVLGKAGRNDLKYLVGTMIEIPRAALTADQVAKEAEFFSFGTNDLTQTTMGLSRDDYTKFQKDYENAKIFKNDPFAVLDQEGVGKLIEMAVKLGRATRKDLEIGICGEHGGEPSSVQFCYRVGMNYVSCSPYRVPIARLAAAQARDFGGQVGNHADRVIRLGLRRDVVQHRRQLRDDLNDCGAKRHKQNCGKDQEEERENQLDAHLPGGLARVLLHPLPEVVNVHSQSRREAGSETIAVQEHLRHAPDFYFLVALAQVAKRVGPACAGQHVELHQIQLFVQFGEQSSNFAGNLAEGRVQGLAGFEVEHHQIQRGRQSRPKEPRAPADPAVQHAIGQHESEQGPAKSREHAFVKAVRVEDREAKHQQTQDCRGSDPDAEVNGRRGGFPVPRQRQAAAKAAGLFRPDWRRHPDVPQNFR